MYFFVQQRAGITKERLQNELFSDVCKPKLTVAANGMWMANVFVVGFPRLGHVLP